MVHQSTSCEPSPAWTPGIQQRHTDPRPAPHSFEASRGARGQGQSRKRTGNSTEGLGGQGGIPGGGGEGAGRAERQRGELQGPLPKVARDAGDCAWPGAQWVGGDGHQLSGADGEAPRPGYPGDTGEALGISAGTCSPGPQGSPGPPWEGPLPGQQEVLGARKIVPTTGIRSERPREDGGRARPWELPDGPRPTPPNSSVWPGVSVESLTAPPTDSRP